MDHPRGINPRGLGLGIVRPPAIKNGDQTLSYAWMKR